MARDIKRKSKPAGARTARAGRSGTRGSGVQTVYDRLKRDILQLKLEPGEPLDETRLSRRFELSRTPVREALVKLAAEGLATTLPNRNTIVAAIDFSTVPAYFDALILMYRVTTRLAATRRSDADLTDIRAIQAEFARSVREADALTMIDTNRDFHVAIAKAGSNRYYTAFFARLLDEGRRLLRLYFSSYNDKLPQQFVDEHEALIAALVARDADRADRLAGEHATGVVRRIQASLTSGIAGEVTLDGGETTKRR